MGCCLSTTRPTKSLDQDVGTHKLPESRVKGGAPSPALVVEEETVKEVLSETQTPISMPPTACVPKIPITNVSSLTCEPQRRPNDRLKEPVQEQEEISVVSEIYSIGGSFSTTTINDGEEGGEVNQRTIHHSPAKKRYNSRVIAGAKYAGLRSLESSDSRKVTRGHRSPAPSSQVKSRPAQGRTASMVLQRRNVGRRDRDWRQGLVEGSTERLGSRAAVSEVIRERRRAVPSVTGNLDARSMVRKLEESKRIESHDGTVSRESLDNPRVSLECFIFL